IELAPVLLCRRALGRPVRRVIELIGNLRRPVAAHMAVEDVAFDRRAEACRAAGLVGFPAWREHEGTAQREMRLRLLRCALLERDDVLALGRHGIDDAARFLVDRFEAHRSSFFAALKGRATSYTATSA